MSTEKEMTDEVNQQQNQDTTSARQEDNSRQNSQKTGGSIRNVVSRFINLFTNDKENAYREEIREPKEEMELMKNSISNKNEKYTKTSDGNVEGVTDQPHSSNRKSKYESPVLDDSIEKVKKKHRKKIREKNNKIEELEDDLNNTTKELTKTKKKLKEVNNDLKEAQIENEDLMEKISNNNTKGLLKKEKLKTAEKETRINDLETRLDKLITDNENSMKSYKTKIIENEEKLNFKTKELEDVKLKLKTAEDELIKRNNKLESTKTVISTLKEKIKAYEQNPEEERFEKTGNPEIDRKISALRRNMEKNHDEIARLNKENEEIINLKDSKITELKMEIKRITDKLKESDSKYKELETNYNSVKTKTELSFSGNSRIYLKEPDWWEQYKETSTNEPE